MGGEHGRIKRCLDVTERDIETAVTERRSTRLLLEHLAKVSRPGEGAAKVLLVFARMAAEQVAWLEGGLRVELTANGDETSIETKSELGLGMHERVFPVLKMKAPLQEFVQQAEKMPRTIAPLVVAARSARQLVIAASTDASRSKSVPVQISEESIFRARMTKSMIPAQSRGSKSDAVRHSSKPDAIRRSSKPASADGESKSVPASARVTVPAGRIKTIRPTGMAAPAPAPRVKTLRPAATGVPPHRKSLPNMTAVRAPRLPRFDSAGRPVTPAARARPPIPRDEPEDEAPSEEKDADSKS